MLQMAGSLNPSLLLLSRDPAVNATALHCPPHELGGCSAVFALGFLSFRTCPTILSTSSSASSKHSSLPEENILPDHRGLEVSSTQAPPRHWFPRVWLTSFTGHATRGSHISATRLRGTIKSHVLTTPLGHLQGWRSWRLRNVGESGSGRQATASTPSLPNPAARPPSGPAASTRAPPFGCGRR